MRVGAGWKYLYRAADSTGDAMEFMLSVGRDVCAAKRFFKKLTWKGVAGYAMLPPFELPEKKIGRADRFRSHTAR